MSETIENLFQEGRSFPPPENLAQKANAQPDIYDSASADPHAFWVAEAQKLWEHVCVANDRQADKSHLFPTLGSFVIHYCLENAL